MTDVSRLAAELGDWRTGSGAQFERLARAIDAVVERGAFDGTRLPAERRLARGLGVSRSTVSRAYATLREGGVISSRQRSGTVVRGPGRQRAAPTSQLTQITRLMGPERGGIDLSVAAPPLDELVPDIPLTLADAAALAYPHGYVPRGLPALRAELAARESARGTPTDADEVLVTSGAHEALHLIAALFVGRQQRVAVEQLTYPGALEIFERTGARPLGVEHDVAGMRPDALRAALERALVALVYLMPSCHNPTGRAIAAGRRPRLVSIAEEHDVLIVEDATLEDLRFDGPLPSLRSLAPARVLRVGSTSKFAWAGLRVGWIAGPRELIGRLARLKASRDLGGGLLGQLAALQVLRVGGEAMIEARRRQARERMELLAGELERCIPAWRVPRPEGGWSLWIDLGDVDGDAFVAAAGAAGVHVAPGRSHNPDSVRANAIRVCHAAPPETLCEGAARLAHAWRQVTTARASAPRPAPAAAGAGAGRRR